IALNPGIVPIRLQRSYDLFFAVCGAPGDLLMVNAVRNWRDFCKTSVCLLDELWLTQMENCRHFLRILERFDLVILYYGQSVDALSEQIGRKVAFLPPGVDTLLFCPYPEQPKRVIDVYSIGRRSKKTHQRLLQMATEDGLFYLHDSMAGDQCL